MIIDTSAIVAIMNQEEPREVLERSLAAATGVSIGAPTRLECSMVLQGKFGIRGKTLLMRFLQEYRIDTIPFDDAHAETASEAFHRYGKGRHPARLNMGDCASYATARLARRPLLCIGDDFPQTDLELVPLT